MSAPTVPARRRAGSTTAFAAIYKLLLRSLATRGRILGIGALALATVAAAAALGTAHPFDPLRAGTRFVDVVGLIIFVPVGALIFASGAFGDLVDDATLVYLWLRPLHPAIPVLAAYAAAVTICLPLIGVPMLVAALFVNGSAALVTGTLWAVLVGILAYCAVFTLLGLRVRRALPWGLAYILLWEGFVASAGKTASKVALRAYTRSLLSESTGVGLKLATFTITTSVVVPAIVAVVCLLLTVRVLRRRDVA